MNTIIKGKDLYTGPQKHGMTRNLVIRESLQVFKNKNWYQGTATNSNYELLMKDLINLLFPPKYLHHHKRYLCRGIYKTCVTKISDFICRIDKIV